MSIDPPACIAILGAGPIGLEAALYARYLGYEVLLLERGPSASANVLAWGHVPLFSPFGMNASPLAVAAIQAQDPRWQCPAADETLTGAEFHQRFLRPLAQTDLLADALQFDTEVLAVGRVGWLKGEGVGDPRRGDAPFRILCRARDRSERTYEAQAVIDCTGTYGHPNWLGQGGIPAVGEQASAARIEYGLPDVLGRDQSRYAACHTLVVGAGYSAATTVVNLAKLAARQPETRLTWLTRRTAADGPLRRIPNDRLAHRDELALHANTLANDASSPVTHLGGAGITAVDLDPATDQWTVQLSGGDRSSIQVDRIVANVGYRPDNQLYSELQVHECYASGGPIKLAAQLLAQSSADAAADCLDQTSCGPESLQNPEPNFYILGSKSYGRRSQFLLAIGLEQIRELFTLIAGREDLNLYAAMPQRST